MIMSMTATGVQATPQMPNAAFTKVAEAGLEVASAAMELEKALMGNTTKAAQECCRGQGAQQAGPQAPVSQAGTAQCNNPMGGILQQLMQLLQMLVPMLQQMAGGKGPHATGPAMNVANQMPQGAAPSPLGAPGAMQTAAGPMVPVIAMVPASALQAGAMPTAAAPGLLAPGQAAPLAANQAGWDTVHLGANNPQAAMNWVYDTLGTQSVSADDMKQGTALYNIFNNGTFTN
jgi:hypothetical protein